MKSLTRKLFQERMKSLTHVANAFQAIGDDCADAFWAVSEWFTDLLPSVCLLLLGALCIFLVWVVLSAMVTLVASWIDWLGCYMYVRRHVREAAPLAPVEVYAKIMFDEAGPYQLLELEGRVLKVRPEGREEILVACASLPEIKSGYKEKAVVGSTPRVTAPPKGVVSLRADGQIVGMGVRTTVGRQTLLLTATHVLQELAMRDQASIEYNGLEVPFEKSWPLVFASPTGDLDVCGMEVPAKVWSALAVPARKLSTKPTGHKAVSVYGYSQLGRFQVASGVAVADHAPYRLLHTVSTRPSYSGSPLFDGDRVYAIHTEASRTPNRNVATSLLFLNRKESDTAETLWPQVEDIDELDEYEEMRIHGFEERIYFQGRHHYREELDDQPIGNWADYMDSLDAGDGMYLESDSQMSCPKGAKASLLVMPSPLKSSDLEPISGKSQKKSAEKDCVSQTQAPQESVSSPLKKVKRKRAPRAKQSSSSPLSGSGLGPREALKPSVAASTSKPKSIGKAQPPKTPGRPLSGSSKSTPKQQ
jgi:hypothetical protein